MSAVIATPELMAQAATDLASIGSTVDAAHMVAAAPTLSMLPAAADEVSASIAHLFSVHAQGYQALAGQAAAFHEQFVQHLTASAISYASTDAANVTLLQPLTGIAGPVAGAATAAQDTLSGLITNLVTNVTNVVTNITNFVTSIIQAIIFIPIIVIGDLLLLALFAYLAYNHVSIFPPYNI